MRPVLTIALFLSGSAWAGSVDEPSGRPMAEPLSSVGGPIPYVAAVEEPGHAIEGRAVDLDGNPLPGLWIFIGDLELRTADDGSFVADPPPGDYEVVLTGGGLVSMSVAVTVADGATARLSVNMAPSGDAGGEGDGDVIEVIGTRSAGSATVLVEERRESAQVVDSIGSEQIARTGDSNAASAAKRVSGLSVVGGRYVYVRGLGDRYGATTLDGLSLPSPEPERRVVPLDLFPAGFLQSVVVQKTYSADMPGQFGGGIVALTSRDTPDDLVTAVSLSGAFRGGTSMKSGPRAPDPGRFDWLGVDGGHRALPAAVAAAADDEPLHEGDMFGGGYSAADLEKYGEMLPNRWGLTEGKAPLDGNMSIVIGDGADLGPGRFGVLGGLVYRSAWTRELAHREYLALGPNDTLEADSAYDLDGLTHTVQLGGILNMAYEAGPHAIHSTTWIGRVTDDEARTYQGPSFDVGTDIRVMRTKWTERQLALERLAGEHTIGTVQLDWRAGLGLALRSQPDQRETRADLESSTQQWLVVDDEIFMSGLVERTADLAVDAKIPVGDGPSVQFGAATLAKGREVDTRRFWFSQRGPKSTDPAVVSQDPQDIFVPENIGTDGFQFEETTQQTDNYTAGSRVDAAYALVDLPFERIRVNAGARIESWGLSVSTFELFNPDSVPVESKRTNLDVLPTVALTVPIGEKMQLRANYARTVDRPDFRELSPAVYTDVTGGQETHGNVDLLRARIDHVDLRWEWYLGGADQVSIGAFYKHFQDPIETVVVASTIQSLTWDNADSAQDFGVELDVRKDLPVTGLWAGANVAWIGSRVDLGEAGQSSTSQVRPLQGQSPYVANATVGYDHPSGIIATVALNAVGPRIMQVGAQGLPDVIEKPAPQLDAGLAYLLPRGFEIGVRGANLLNADLVQTQGGQEVYRMSPGPVVSATVSWKP